MKNDKRLQCSSNYIKWSTLKPKSNGKVPKIEILKPLTETEKFSRGISEEISVKMKRAKPFLHEDVFWEYQNQSFSVTL